MFLKKLLHYLNPATILRKGPDRLNLRVMNGINRISIFMFLACLIVLIIRWTTR